MPKAKFPKQIYVYIDRDGRDLIAERDCDDMSEERQVAIYRLEQVKKLVIKKELQ